MIRPSTVWLAMACLLTLANVVVFALGGKTDGTYAMICLSTAAILNHLENDDE